MRKLQEAYQDRQATAMQVLLQLVWSQQGQGLTVARCATVGAESCSTGRRIRACRQQFQRPQPQGVGTVCRQSPPPIVAFRVWERKSQRSTMFTLIGVLLCVCVHSHVGRSVPSPTKSPKVRTRPGRQSLPLLICLHSLLLLCLAWHGRRVLRSAVAVSVHKTRWLRCPCPVPPRHRSAGGVLAL